MDEERLRLRFKNDVVMVIFIVMVMTDEVRCWDSSIKNDDHDGRNWLMKLY